MFFCVLSAAYAAFRVSALPPRSLPFWEIRHTPLLFRLKILCILTPILRCSSGLLHFFLQPLLSDLVGKLLDSLHDSVKQVVDVHGRSLLVVVYALTYRRDGESVGLLLEFFSCLLPWTLLTGIRRDVSAGISRCRVAGGFPQGFQGRA
ncbi:hypothetical protein TRIP_B180016 [uncultured Desulfatiglans sp.]|uniref:Uncharacterized protein n=1 Tax=Uncultured Desulfatiglans sp. TaxID=1748965 RepID=A0A653A1A5_UNCDX|nr:hypothetical protein TRIP_B180016 [uncultured Desulfatiglans sp.]